MISSICTAIRHHHWSSMACSRMISNTSSMTGIHSIKNYLAQPASICIKTSMSTLQSMTLLLVTSNLYPPMPSMNNTNTYIPYYSLDPPQQHPKSPISTWGGYHRCTQHTVYWSWGMSSLIYSHHDTSSWNGKNLENLHTSCSHCWSRPLWHMTTVGQSWKR